MQRLRERGWIEGRTVTIEYRWSEGRTERYPEIAAEFVRLKVDVIVTTGGGVPAVKQATSAIPIVFPVAGDPVGGGFVATLARPGGNVTGLSLQQTDIASKRAELLRDAVPGLQRMAALLNGGNANAMLELGEIQATARARACGGHVGNPASRGYRVCFRGAQGSCGWHLCRGRPAGIFQPGPHPHLGHGRAVTGDLQLS